MASRQVDPDPEFSPTWHRGRGPLRILPPMVFRDRRAWQAIVVAWLLTISGSTALGFLLARLAPGHAGPDLGDASAPMTLFLVAVFSPIVETLIMAGVLQLLLRWLAPWQSVVASAVLWGILHSLASPLWGAVIWWPFLIFSTLYVTWRGRGVWRAVGIVTAVHVLQNVFPAILIVLHR